MSGHRLFDVSGKSGYVTGGGSGLGRAIALGMAEARRSGCGERYQIRRRPGTWRKRYVLSTGRPVPWR